MIKIDIRLPPLLVGITKCTFSLLENHFDIECIYQQDGADLTIATEHQGDITLSQKFIRAFEKSAFLHTSVFDDRPLILRQDGTPDYLGSCIYMVHYLQELVDKDQFDDLSRFKYTSSYQSKFDCCEENLVLQYLIKLVKSTPQLTRLKRKTRRSRLFVSHDIDILVKGIWPDLKTAIRRFDFSSMLRLLFIEALKDQDLQLFERILKINEAHDVPSMFFWMVNNMPYQSETITVENANYRLEDHTKYIQFLTRCNAQIGLHQSIGGEGIEVEKSKLRGHIIYNRNHYLHGRLPELWDTCDASGIKVDCTAGFSERMGFRNSYGYPVRPFSIKENKQHQVLEVPLNIMEVSFMNQSLSPSEALDRIKDYMDHHRTDSVISLLWHNNYFSATKFPQWIETYKKILIHAKQSGIQPISIAEIQEEFWSGLHK